MIDEAQTHLDPPGVWFLDGRRMARWSPRSRAFLGRTRQRLADHLGGHIPRVCTHLRGHGGVKGAIRTVSSLLGRANYVARFDIASYYGSMSHEVLQSLLRQTGAGDRDCAVVSDYLRLPDTRRTGRGMIASGGLSPLLGGLYLVPLDRSMVRLRERGQLVCYVRYMDDIVLLTRTRWQLRRAISILHAVLRFLHLRLHKTKRYIGKTTVGFDFLGYRLHRGRKLRPSGESLHRLRTRASRLYERGADVNRLRLYVRRWRRWLHGGLRGCVSRQGGDERIIRHILTLLRITEPHRCCGSGG